MTGTRADRLQRFGIFVVAILAAASLVIGIFVLSTGRDTNTIVHGQEQSDANRACLSEYAAADRIAGSNLDVAKAEEIDLFAQAAILGDTAPLADKFDAAHARTAVALAERIRVARAQVDLNDKCDPERAGGVVEAPQVTPIEALDGG